MLKKMFLFVAMAILPISCITYPLNQQELNMEMGNEKVYKLLKDIKNDGTTVLKRGARVKIVIKVLLKSVKVYGYQSDEDLLKSKRYLILYMFEEDFSGKKINRAQLDAELSKIIRRVK